ncbi:MAG: ATP-dependent zinc metalloprotease FtsH [Myxococcota bacterium]
MAFLFQEDKTPARRDKKRAERDDSRKRLFGGDKRFTFSLWYVALALLVLSLYRSFSGVISPQELTYSEFRALVKQKAVQEAVLTPDRVRGTLKEKDPRTGKPVPFNVVRVEDPELVSLLEKSGVKYGSRIENTFLRDFFLAWVLPIGLLFLLWSFLLRRMGTGASGIMSFGKSRAKIYAEADTGVTFEDVAGIDEAKAELQEIVDFLKSPEKYRRLGGRIPKGVLLVGAPGTGKTLLARAVAGQAKVPFFSLSGSDFVEMFVGVGAARVRDLFQQAAAQAPCIMFIDELDAIGKARGLGPVVGGNDEREQTLNQLLSEMDGFDPEALKKGVIIMAATNRPEILDPALLRAGRFDRRIVVDRPDLRGREAILKIHAQGVTLADDVKLATIAARTPGMVGSDLAALVNEAALLAARRGRDAVSMADFEEAIDRVIAGLERRSRMLSPREKRIVAFHEAGHALVAISCPNAEPVHKISIIPRSIGALGYTQQLPTEDRYLMTRSELLDRLAVLLGGRCAEEVVFGEVSTGAMDDLQRATDIARAMVTEYGMSDKLGPVVYEQGRRPSFLEGPWQHTPNYGDDTAKIVDAELARLVDDARGRALDILTRRRKDLEALATALMENEVIDAEDLARIVGPDPGG